MRAQLTVLEKAEEERFIKKCAVIVRSAKILQKNVSKGAKNGLMELEDLPDRISFYNWT